MARTKKISKGKTGTAFYDDKPFKKTVDEYTWHNPISLLDKIISYSTDDLKNRLSKKNKEYAGKDDVYHNFLEGAKLCNCEPMQYLYYLMTKHLVSVKDIVDKGLNDKDLIAEKCGDIRAYITLLEGYYLFA